MFNQIEVLRAIKTPDTEGGFTREYRHLSYVQGAMAIHDNVIQIAVPSGADAQVGDIVVLDGERYLLSNKIGNPRARYAAFQASRGVND